jgi:GNAT superfamily N-acetyltransferase
VAGFEIVEGYAPGSLGRVASLHGTYYGENWGFGVFFEAKVATELSAFLTSYESGRDGFWTVSRDGDIQASIAIDGTDSDGQGAHLRWFIVSGAMHGEGVGGQLLRTGLDFCKSQGYRNVYLWTFGGLDAARHLYERAGFVLTEERLGAQWGSEVLEQRFDCALPPSA